MASDEKKETDGHEADKLLRTVCRAFLNDTCSIVLDIILRNHYQTCEDDIVRVCKGVPPTVIRSALATLDDAGLITKDERPPVTISTPIPPDQLRRRRPRRYERYVYTNQHKELSVEEERERKKQANVRAFYYVDYHEAVEVIRFRLYRLLKDESGPVAFAKCTKCAKEYSEDAYWKCYNDSAESAYCPACEGVVSPCGSGRASVSATEDGSNTRSSRFEKALQPLINLLGVVMKKSFVPFKDYSDHEQALIEESRKQNASKDRTNAGYVDEVVNIQEALEECPGALAKSVRVRNGAIPWLIPSSFFNEDGTPCVRTKRPRTGTAKSAALSPAAKKPRAAAESTEDDDQQKSEIPLSDEDVEVIRATLNFDKRLEEALAHADVSSEDEAMPAYDMTDTASIRSGSTCSVEVTEMYNSDSDGLSNLPSPQQEQDQKNAGLSQRVCSGFDVEVLAPHVVTVDGECRPLNALTIGDLSRMSDAEYDAYAHVVAMIAGIS